MCETVNGTYFIELVATVFRNISLMTALGVESIFGI